MSRAVAKHVKVVTTAAQNVKRRGAKLTVVAGIRNVRRWRDDGVSVD